MATRDRDEEGRARNARPRDAFGRPLAHGNEGVERIPEDLILEPADTLVRSQQLLDSGHPFHAHEVLEAAWKSAPDDERDLWQGLAQLAVGLTHVQRGNAKGAVALLRRGVERAQPYEENPPHGINIGRLSAHAIDLAARIERDGLEAVTAEDVAPELSARS